MKRIVIYLFSAAIVFVITLVFTNKYMNDRATEEADRVNELQVNNVSKYLDARLLVWERSALGFLIGEMNIGKHDSISHDSTNPFGHPRFEGNARVIIRKEDIPWLRKTIYDDLRNFLSVNHQVYSIAFLMEPGVFGKEAWGPTVMRGDTTNYNLINIYDYLHANSYTTVKRTGKVMWNKPSKKSELNGKMMMYQIPIYLENGEFAGIFEMDVDLKRLCKALTNFLPYGTEGSSTTIVDNSGNIILSTDTFYQRYSNRRELEYSFRHDYGCKQVLTGVHHHNVWTYNGENYFLYHQKLVHAPWLVFTICHEYNVYASLNKTKTVIMLVSVFGMVLIFLCLYLVFRQMRRDLRQKAAAEEELKMAAQVQMSLLKPQNLKTSKPYELTAFMRPAKKAGGDLYDYVEQNDKLIFCIGDVSGKGMPAALFMTQVVSLFRNAVRQTQDPSKIVSLMNDVLAADNPKMTFCTFFVGVISPMADGGSDYILSFCNAGHNPPVLITSEAKYMKVYPNIALGLMENYPYKSETIPFPSGTRLINYTDGVTEAKDNSHRQYGEERLLSLFSDAETHKAGNNINNIIINSVEQFSRNTEQSDDITIVTVTKVSEILT